MKRGLPIVVALCAVMLVGLAGPAGAYSNNFDSDTAGWFDFGGTITQQPSGYPNPAYADGITSASDGFHARLGRGPCVTQTGGSGDAVNCYGPYTYWGDGNSYTWNGPYTTQVDIYLDTVYANANPDTYSGNLADLTAPDGYTDPTVEGTRFDYTSAINSSTPDGNGDAQHLRDFGFNVSTGYADDGCDGFMITGQTVVNRINANPNIGGHDPQCIDETGWYTFKHSFSEENGFLKVVMDIIPVDPSSEESTKTWTITGIDPIATVGCERYGWFSNQEIYGLPIDNASMTGGCAETPHVGVIAPTGTTCQQYRDNETTPTPVLEQLLYTTKGSKINAVSPGVFFYYTKVSGDTGDLVSITEENDANTAPDIPINQGQVVLYDASTCKVVKWTVTLGPEVGEATGTLPKDGDFIIGVKYSPSSLKGKDVPDPTTVTYSFGAKLSDVAIDEATIDLVPKT